MDSKQPEVLERFLDRFRFDKIKTIAPNVPKPQ
jgi:hypothetical protein